MARTRPYTGDLQIDLGRYELRQNGDRMRLERQPMELLILLVEKRGFLVTRDEIVARLWRDGVFLDTERSINNAIRKIRLALHDDPDDPHVIETVVGKGYRFIAQITVIPAEPQPSAHDGVPERAASDLRRLPRSWWIATSGIAVLICLTLAFLIFGRKSAQTPSGRQSVQSLAVLPLENLSGDSNEQYFADGMTETLTTDIAKISGLRVISRTSVLPYRHSGKTLPQIARELKVDAVIEGSVARSKGRVRITAQLVEAGTDRHLWADTYERDAGDVLALEDEVARAIARQVHSRLSAQGQNSTRHYNPAAEDAYLKGLEEADKFSREGLETSVAYFQEAVRADPEFAQAWAGLARSYNLLALFHYGEIAPLTAAAEAAATKSLQLDDNLSEAHAVMGGVLMHHGRSWAESERELRRSIALNPSNAIAHQSLGYLLAGVLGRFDEGIHEMNVSLDLDPLSPSKRNSLGAAYYWARRYDDALRVFREVPDGDANTERRHRRMAEIYDSKGMQRQSIEELERAAGLTGRKALASAVEKAFRSSGYAAARKAFFAGDIRERQAAVDSGAALWVAIDYAVLGDRDHAFRWLDKAFEQNDESLMYLKVEWHYDSLRADPRFAAALHHAGLD